MAEKQFCVYILASREGGALYIGVTSNLIQRVYQHREELIDGHGKKYHIHQLVYYEIHENAESAILREKRLKKWTRAMKNDLIRRENPLWEDLYSQLAVA
ncbi:MAG: GIY-YIG nuclease family protein [Alphaproteobacteria bacterium]